MGGAAAGERLGADLDERDAVDGVGHGRLLRVRFVAGRMRQAGGVLRAGPPGRAVDGERPPARRRPLAEVGDQFLA